MSRKVKIEKLMSRRYTCMVVTRQSDGAVQWFVRDRDSMADTEVSHSIEDYTKLKRVWRKSKEDFESACRFMDFHNLFTQAGVKL